MTERKINITGVMVQYYVTCHRELWFFANQVNMNYNNEDIEIGKLIHETSYSRKNKEISFENMVFDFVQTKDGLEIFEVKKSSKLTIGAKYQLYYYMFTIKENYNKKVKGFLVYPKEKKREEIKLTNETIKELKQIIEDIPKIIKQKTPPKAKKKPFCKNCSFYELCMV